jgi:hypothetical protein
MNKFILKMTIVDNEDCTLIIDIVQWDSRFICDQDNFREHPFCYFADSQEFSIFSQNEGGIYDNCLEIPEYKYLYDSSNRFLGCKLKADFFNEDRRYLYVKGLYRCLSEWSVNYERFKNDVHHTDRIILNSNFWIK